MYKLIVLLALAVGCLAAPRPSLVYSYPQVLAPVAQVPVAYSAQSSTVVHSAPVYHAAVVSAVPVIHTVRAPVFHSVPVTYV